MATAKPPESPGPPESPASRTTPEPPVRTCRTCGNVERNFHYRCTNCGRDYAAPPPRFSKRAKVIAATVAGVAIVVGLAIAIPALLTTKSEKTAEQSAADRAAAAREAARLRVTQRPHAGRLAAKRDDPTAPAARRVAAGIPFTGATGIHRREPGAVVR